MFERYTPSARRVLFFARSEVSRLGGTSIETEHLLLGLMSDENGLASQIFARLPLESIRGEIEGRTAVREKALTSAEVPFSAQAKRALNFAREEADHLLHPHIGPEHLVLGLLREDNSVAASILTAHGLRLNDLRLQIVQLQSEIGARSASQVSGQIDKIKNLVAQLGRTPPESNEARDLVDLIGDALDSLRPKL